MCQYGCVRKSEWRLLGWASRASRRVPAPVPRFERCWVERGAESTAVLTDDNVIDLEVEEVVRPSHNCALRGCLGTTVVIELRATLLHRNGRTRPSHRRCREFVPPRMRAGNRRSGCDTTCLIPTRRGIDGRHEVHRRNEFAIRPVLAGGYVDDVFNRPDPVKGRHNVVRQPRPYCKSLDLYPGIGPYCTPLGPSAA